MKKYYYTYYSYEVGIENCRGYIGKRECVCLPEEDVKYFGTFKDKTFNPVNKIIIGVFETREEALKSEVHLHYLFNVSKEPHFANKAKQTSTKFSYCPKTEEVSGEFNSMFGKKNPSVSERMKLQTGELNHMFGRTGELHPRPWLGKKNPALSEKNKLRTGELNPMFGKKNPAQSERMKLRTGELNSNFGKKWWVNNEGEIYYKDESPGPEWQNGMKWKHEG
jgi:hypothetical protein